MSSHKNILILCLTDPTTTPRPARLLRFLHSQGHSVDICAHPTENPIECNAYYALKKPCYTFASKVERKLIRALPPLYKNPQYLAQINDRQWGLENHQADLVKAEYDVIFVEDIHLLPFALTIKNNSKIILDAREYYPQEIGNNLVWKIFESGYRKELCQKYLPQCDQILTVSPNLQKLYENNFNLKTSLFMSLPDYVDITPTEEKKRDHTKMVHHGLANPDRGLEGMIEIFETLDDRYSLDFYLKGSPKYIEKLKAMSSHSPRIRFCDPVPFEQINTMLSSYDIGLYLLQPTGMNTKFALPNKLFEFIQARLAVVTGPSPDMAAIIHKYECGFTADSFKPQDTAELLNKLSYEDIFNAKGKSHKAAQELCYEKQSEVLASLLQAA